MKPLKIIFWISLLFIFVILLVVFIPKSTEYNDNSPATSTKQDITPPPEPKAYILKNGDNIPLFPDTSKIYWFSKVCVSNARSFYSKKMSNGVPGKAIVYAYRGAPGFVDEPGVDNNINFSDEFGIKVISGVWKIHAANNLGGLPSWFGKD